MDRPNIPPTAKDEEDLRTKENPSSFSYVYERPFDIPKLGDIQNNRHEDACAKTLLEEFLH